VTSALSGADKLRARFNLAVGYANRALSPGASARKDLRTAAEHARVVRNEANRLRAQKTAAGTLASNLHRPTTALLAGILVRLDALKREPPSDPPERSTSPELDDESNERQSELTHPHKDEVAKLDKEIAQYGYVDDDPPLAYALACYRAARGAHHDAMAHLVAAVIMPSLQEWAPRDPWLDPLKDLPEWKRLFPPKGEHELGVDYLMNGLGLTAVGIGFGPFSPSADPDWEIRGVVSLSGEPAQVVLKVSGATSATPVVQVRVDSSDERLRAVRVRVGDIEAVLPHIGERPAGWRLFLAPIPRRPTSWVDLRAWLIIDPL
jgi:hypothetical protein